MLYRKGTQLLNTPPSLTSLKTETNLNQDGITPITEVNYLNLLGYFNETNNFSHGLFHSKQQQQQAQRLKKAQ